jgi:hypothetical protein
VQALEPLEELARQPQTPQRFVAAGGLASFNIAQDLLNVEFGPPERAPEQFRAIPYDAQRITTLSSGVSGRVLICFCL